MPRGRVEHVHPHRRQRAARRSEPPPKRRYGSSGGGVVGVELIQRRAQQPRPCRVNDVDVRHASGGRGVGAVEHELEDRAPQRVVRLRGEDSVDQPTRCIDPLLVREDGARVTQHRCKGLGALVVEVGVEASVAVHDEVARGVAPLDVRGVGVVR